MNVLSCHWLVRPGSSIPGPLGSKTERRYLDFIVDGKSLHELTGAGNFDMIGVLGWAGLEADRKAIRQLLLELPAVLPAGRQQIFVCAECGDIGCGSITAHVSSSGDCYVWRDFAYENDYDEAMSNRASFKHVGPFTFAATQYREALLAEL
jgi:hypothetical protein